MAVEPNEQVLKSKCLCGVHVHTATKIAVGIQLIIQCLGVLMALIGGSTGIKHEESRESAIVSSTLTALYYALGVIVCYMVLHGLKVRRPGYYWPYLAWTMIGIMSVVVVIVVILIFALFSESGVVNAKGDTVMFGMLIIMVCIGLLVDYIYFSFVIVNRSRKLLEAELLNTFPSVAYNSQSIPPYNPQYMV